MRIHSVFHDLVIVVALTGDLLEDFAPPLVEWTLKLQTGSKNINAYS